MARYEHVLVDKHTGEKTIIKANHSYLLNEKINRKVEIWNNRAVRTSTRRAKDAAKAYKESKLEEATERTEEANEQISAFGSILTKNLESDEAINWDNLFNTDPFHAFNPPKLPAKDDFFSTVAKESFWELLWPPMKTKRIAAEVAAQFSFDKAIIAHE